MKRNNAFPGRVPPEEIPEYESMPEEIKRRAYGIATKYAECPECETRQWMNSVPGHNSHHECIECGEDLMVVG